MSINMHCRLTCPTNNSACSSVLFVHSDYTNTLKHRACSPLSYHDRIPASRRRRRLEDPVIAYASNYYVTNPHQTSHSPSSTSLLPSSDRIYQQSDDKHIYCDLFNLLERPQPIKQRKNYTLTDTNPCRGHRSIVYKNAHTKIKDINERKRHHQQQSSCYKENKHQNDNSLSIQQYDQLQDQTKPKTCIYQRHLSRKGFFRRVVRNYFCMPMTIPNGEFLN